ncbi:MAG: S8 family serine peptidase [Candidatus Aenigmarchaeota archaeon]|nr:S8 family serine peptidase [Candidatus Aenigmarchaeota archaeon]
MKRAVSIIIVLIVAIAIIQYLAFEGFVVKKVAKLKIKEVKVVGKEKKILLKSRQISPGKRVGLDFQPPGYYLIQLDHIPTPKEQQQLSEEGIELLEYIPEQAWIAKVNNPSATTQRSEVTYLAQLEEDDKISPNLENPAEWSINSDGSLTLIVYFFKDIDLEESAGIVERKGGTVTEEFPTLNALKVGLKPGRIRQLAREGEVKWIDQLPPPMSELNDGIRSAANVNTIQAAPYNLKGSGVTVLVYDGGLVLDSHNDLIGRVTQGEGGESVASHATHVAGTVGGSGVSCRKGMAPNVTIVSYGYGNCVPYCLYNTSTDLEDDYNESLHIYNASINTNSIGSNAGLNGYSCAFNGDYETTAQLVDQTVRGSLGRPFISIWAAGNERSYACTSTWAPYPGYNTTGVAATAKNNIVVGAVDDSEAMSSFSSWGPTDDGRIRPDVVVPGVSISSLDDDSNSDCTVKSGTSMATPAVAGIAAIVVEDYKNYNSNNVLLPSTMKALLTHTAKDLNETGPDYTTGWGLVNATAAVDKVRENVNSTVIVEDNITATGDSKTYSINASGTESELKITLAWDDYEGTPLAAKALVNDLDLIVTAPNSSQAFPWTLNVSNPTQPASQLQKDDINPIEQVLVSSPAAGEWIVVVNGTSVPQANQSFSLISSHELQSNNLTITLNSPSNNTLTGNTTIEFNCSVFDIQNNLTNISLYTSALGNWALNQTSDVSGASNSSSWELAGIPEGKFEWNCLAFNELNESNFSASNFTLTIDATNPTWENNASDIHSTYAESASVFNVTWNDSTGMDSVLIEGNWSGSAMNYTMVSFGNNVTNHNETLPAGTFYWISFGNDTAGNENSTEKIEFTIDKATSNVTLLLNSTQGNISAVENSSINFTVIVSPNQTILLFINNSLSGNSSGRVENISVLESPGTYNITAIFEENQNYSVNFTTYNLIVNDTTSPNITAANISQPLASVGENITIIAKVSDNGVLDTIRFNITNSTANFTGTLYSAGIGLFNSSINTSSLLGMYSVTIHANDSWGNEVNLSAGSLEVASPVNVSMSINNNAGNATNVTRVKVYYNGTSILRAQSTTNVSEFIASIPTGFFDIAFETADFNATIFSTNISAETNRNISLDSGFSVSTGLPSGIIAFRESVSMETGFNFSKVSLSIQYTEGEFTSESRVHPYACHTWNFSARTCEGSWESLLANYSLSTSGNFVIINSTNLSAFSIAENFTCGDSVCDSSESCSSCSTDCGACATTGGSSGGGGGGGSSPVTCTESWNCTPWGQCQKGTQTRECVDENSCNTTTSKPVESQSCSYCGDNKCDPEEKGSCPQDCPAPKPEPPKKICIPDELKCSGNNVTKCSPDGMQWLKQESCDFGCKEGKCLPGGSPAGRFFSEQPAVAATAVGGIVAAIIIVAFYLRFYRKRKRN